MSTTEFFHWMAFDEWFAKEREFQEQVAANRNE